MPSDDSLNSQSTSCNKCGSTQLQSCSTCKWNLSTCDNCGPQLDGCSHCSTQFCSMIPLHQTPEQNQRDSEESGTILDFPGTITDERCTTPATDDTDPIPHSEFSAYMQEHNYSFPHQSIESLLREHQKRWMSRQTLKASHSSRVMKTRSMGRGKALEFFELDQSGKPQRLGDKKGGI
ncbi:hypothetical protein HDV63DRAFT_376234 [Trichoderma sp. SZMC 28014]